MKKLKINYLFIGILTLLLAAALWPSIPWFGKTENHIAAIQARGVLRVSTIDSPLTYSVINGKKYGLDYELAQQFANYLGVKLKVTVRQNISQLFDDLDNGNADLLAAGLVYDSARVKNYQPGPMYYSVSQQLVYRVGQYRPRSLATVNENQLTIAPGHVVVNDLQRLKETKFPELAVALDVTDEQPVTWFSRLDDDNTLSAALLDFFNSINEDGSLARIEEKYLGHGDDFDYVDTRSFLRAVDNVLPELEPLFKKYAKEIDWRLLAAISYQESHWDPLATSPTGVRGLMMLTKNTAQSLGLTDRTDAEQSISGGARYLEDMMAKVPETVPEDERIWFALAAYNMGYAHMLDARSLTVKTKGNPDSWTDVKQRLPLLSQKPYYSKLTYGYARGHEAYAYVENIRKYQISLVGYLQEKEKQEAEAMKLAQDYPAVSPEELNKAPFPFLSFLSQSSGYLTHSPSLLFTPQKKEEK
ncbi:TPA: membrane-bound lytic murein transglycosylase MltF [Salmonella enterica subsp. enterica serovar Typhimurium]|nr:membrane-bound lytic murein transglycosylase MltF [Salmonella enterica subsp. enterica serovar Typhimurium]HDN8922672.1 membrane-bound lytic murein transglycosylase MltF [Salmonella enterica subsp. enterica serovar Typhimurium]HDO5612571.1 membrane-bound lytic murein transglycosylase MltF [Salmonella enterica subsp. enterica serovar Typhimurium]HDO5625732.1 membrane-bound lytic murein transglycosylase MltF [Salmonella enterica subsp. enterica serovar Typhimurium]HDO6177223.1 membrane-bound l